MLLHHEYSSPTVHRWRNDFIPRISVEHFTTTGVGLEECDLSEGAKFDVTTKDIHWQLFDVNEDKYAVESKEAEIKSSVLWKEKGVYEVSYYPVSEVKECEQISLAVTQLGRHIDGSPFSV